LVISRVERGLGHAVSIDSWQRIALAVGRPLLIGLQRDIGGETADAGHLAMQELVLRTGRRAGFDGTFELATRSAEPWRSIDVVLSHDTLRILLLVECWNTIGDVGAAASTSARKLAEAVDLAAARWGDMPAKIGLVWVVRSSARNRALVAAIPRCSVRSSRALPAAGSRRCERRRRRPVNPVSSGPTSVLPVSSHGDVRRRSVTR
jgi:hypothetical protein